MVRKEGMRDLMVKDGAIRRFFRKARRAHSNILFGGANFLRGDTSNYLGKCLRFGVKRLLIAISLSELFSYK